MDDKLEAVEREKGKRGGGGKLSRSETVTVRLDPKLNYLCELAARTQRRTKSSYIEWAIESTLRYAVVPGVNTPGSIQELAEALWDVDEADRLAQLAFNAPTLMTHEEQVMWRLVETNGFMWRGHYHAGKWVWNVGPSYFRWEVFRDHFQVFRGVAEGEAPKSELPTWQEEETPKFDADLDEDCPF